MKFKIFWILYLITVSTTRINAQFVAPIVKTDKRIEFLSVVSKLSEFSEYKNDNYKDYSEKVDAHFKEFKEHKLIDYFKQLRKERNIAYDAIMSLAIRIEIYERVKIVHDVENLDSRWDKKDLTKLEELLNDFYSTTNFENFYNTNKILYQVAVKSLELATKEINYNWFREYYGQLSQDNYVLVAGMLLGYHNYGPSVKIDGKQKELFSILGVSHTSPDGLPYYSQNIVEDIAIHEFTHSFMNPLVDEFFQEMEEQATNFYNISKLKLKKMAYGEPLIAYRESFVRAGVIEYYKQHNETEFQIMIRKNSESSAGFYLVPFLVDYLNDYNQKRSDFSSFREYMPVIVERQNNLSAKQIKREFNKLPKGDKCWVVASSISNNSKNVDPKTGELVLFFNTPLNLWSLGITSNGEKQTGFDNKRVVKWNYETGKEVIIPLSLEPNMDYSIKFFGFRTVSNRKMKKSYILNFSTSDIKKNVP
jgi:hypothetical protein